MLDVLVADGQELVREGVRQILQRSLRFQVVGEAANTPSTMALVRSTPAHVLIVDLSMPGRNGAELIREIHDAQTHLRILVLTMHVEQQYAVRAFKAGASGYMTKECSSAELLLAVDKVANDGVYVSLAMAEQYARSLQQPLEDLPHQQLSDREFDVLRRITVGDTITEIANALSLSAKTVSTYKARILEKMQLPHEAALVRYAVQHKLFDDEV